MSCRSPSIRHLPLDSISQAELTRYEHLQLSCAVAPAYGWRGCIDSVAGCQWLEWVINHWSVASLVLEQPTTAVMPWRQPLRSVIVSIDAQQTCGLEFEALVVQPSRGCDEAFQKAHLLALSVTEAIILQWQAPCLI